MNKFSVSVGFEGEQVADTSRIANMQSALARIDDASASSDIAAVMAGH